MKKVILILCLIFILVAASGCLLMRLKNMILVDKEKIGAEFIVIENWELSPDDSHGSVKNYSSSFKDNVWTTKFDFMNSTGYRSVDIDPGDILNISCSLDSGDVWVKITQGSLVESEIQKIQAVKGETITANLSRWEPGEIVIWLVVEGGEDGEIQIEHVKQEVNE